MNNQVSTKKNITGYLNSSTISEYLNDVIGDKKDKFITNLVSVTNQNKDLQKCNNATLMSGALAATTLNLNLNSAFGYAYLVPFKNNKLSREKGHDVYEAQFQIGYKGFIQLALRTGEYQKINAIPVYKSQFKSWNALTEEINLNALDDFSDDEVVGYVAYFKLTNGFEKTIYWSLSKMEKHADTYSKAFNLQISKNIKDGKIPQNEMWKYSSFWYKDFDGMALKTMLRQMLSKWGILSEELQRGLEEDQSVIKGDNKTYIDNEDDEPQQPFSDLNSLGNIETKQDNTIDIEIETKTEAQQMKEALVSKGVSEEKAEDWCMNNATVINTFLVDPASIDVVAEELLGF